MRWAEHEASIGRREVSKKFWLQSLKGRVFENRVLRRIFRPKRDKVTGEWSTLHSEEIYNMYSCPNIIRQIKLRRTMCAGHVALTGEERKVCKLLARKPIGKRPLGRTMRRWEDRIRMDLGEIVLGVWSGLNWLSIRTGGWLL
jgi:hypothetical protein